MTATKSREQLGYDLVYWSNAYHAVLEAAARRVCADRGAPVGSEWMSLFDVLEWAQLGGYITETDLADWRHALGIRADYLTEKRPATHLLAETAETFERLEGALRERLGAGAPPRPVRYPEHRPL